MVILKAILLITILLMPRAQALAACRIPNWELHPLPHSRLIDYKTFFSDAHGGNATYGVYLPPHYALDPITHYPVLYWLHGGASNLKSGSNFVARLDSAIARGVAPPFIVVLPNGPQSMWTDSNPVTLPYNSPIETLIIDELIPLIDATYRTIASREGRGIEGFSMGGRGASRMGLKFPDLFSVVSDLAGAVQDWDYFVASDPANVVSCIFGDDAAYFEASSPQTHAAENAAFIQAHVESFKFRVVVGSSDVVNYQVNGEFRSFLRDSVSSIRLWSLLVCGTIMKSSTMSWVIACSPFSRTLGRIFSGDEMMGCIEIPICPNPKSAGYSPVLNGSRMLKVALAPRRLSSEISPPSRRRTK